MIWYKNNLEIGDVELKFDKYIFDAYQMQRIGKMQERLNEIPGIERKLIKTFKYLESGDIKEQYISLKTNLQDNLDVIEELAKFKEEYITDFMEFLEEFFKLEEEYREELKKFKG